MVGTIEELEKSIEEFQNNIAASGELCRLIENYVSQAKQQDEIFNKQTDLLLQKLVEIPSVIDAKNLESNKALEGKITAELEDTVRELAEEQKKYIDAVSEASKIVVLKSQAITDQMEHSQTRLTEEFAAVQKEMKACESQLEQKYNEFTETIATMNISNLYVQNQELKRSLDTRTLILMVLSIASVIIGIVGMLV